MAKYHVELVSFFGINAEGGGVATHLLALGVSANTPVGTRCECQHAMLALGVSANTLVGTQCECQHAMLALGVNANTPVGTQCECKHAMLALGVSASTLNMQCWH